MKSRLKISLLILISLISHSLLSQKETAIWYFGDSAGLDFNTVPPSSLTSSAMYYALEASGTVSDKNGNLLFYTDGQTVWNKNHEIMEGGNGLEGSETASQSGLILNHPDNDSLYYIFLTPYSYHYMNGLKYCLVNIKANNGNGKVIEKNMLLHPNSSEKVSAVYHANGRDIWIIGHEWGNNNFYLYLLTGNGFNECPVINPIGIEYKRHSIYTEGKFMNQGFLKFTQNSKYMAHVFTPDPLDVHSELYRFNNLSGGLEYYMKIDTEKYPHGTEFTHDSKYLLIARSFSQERLLKIDIENKVITEEDTLGEGALLQISIDGNIYLGLADSTFVGTINGNDFDNIQVNKKAVNLSKGKMQYGFPNLFVGYLTHGQPRIQYENRCNSNQTFDFGLSSFATNVAKWIFTHPHSEFERTDNSPSIAFADTGLWLVRCVLASNDTAVTTVFVEPAIVPNFLGSDTGWCNSIGTPIVLNAPSGMHCYEWNTGETTSQITADTTGIYIAKITTPNFCVLYDTINVTIDPTPQPPNIYKTNDTLRTDSLADVYQWYKDNQPIGKNQNWLKVSDSGIYQLQVRTFGGCSAWSDTIHIPATKTEDTSNISVNSVNLEKKIRITPNPFDKELIITFLEYEEGSKVIIKDINGKEVLTKIFSSENDLQQHSYTFKTSNLVPSVYFVHYITKDTQLVKKVVLLR